MTTWDATRDRTRDGLVRNEKLLSGTCRLFPIRRSSTSAYTCTLNANLNAAPEDTSEDRRAAFRRCRPDPRRQRAFLGVDRPVLRRHGPVLTAPADQDDLDRDPGRDSGRDSGRTYDRTRDRRELEPSAGTEPAGAGFAVLEGSRGGKRTWMTVPTGPSARSTTSATSGGRSLDSGRDPSPSEQAS